MESITPTPSLTEQTTEAIRKAILAGDLAIGGLYSASELAKQIGVSRTPVREALLELERRGLVQIEKNRGARILSTSIDSLVEVFQLRLMIELPLSRRATELRTPSSLHKLEAVYDHFQQCALDDDPDSTLRADRDFHTALLASSKNHRALRLLAEQRDFVLTTGIGTVPASRTPIECFEDHCGIMDGFREGNPDRVASELGRHIINTASMIVQQEASQGLQIDIPSFIDSLHAYVH